MRADLGLMAALVVLALGLRAWQLAHTEVAARDSIGFIRIAWQLEHGDLAAVLRASQQHPAYPATVAVFSHAVRPFFPDDLPRAMQLSCQLVSILASLVLVIPMFLLGRELFDRGTAFWGTALFQCLPASGRVLGDGLSEPLFLLFAATALAAAAAALRRGSPALFALSGLMGGLAFLTRPEGGLIVASAEIVLLACQAVPRWRQAWSRWAACGVALALPALLVAVPYVRVIGKLSAKPTTTNVLDKMVQAPAAGSSQGVTRAPVLFADWWTGSPAEMDQRNGWAARTLVHVLLNAFGYVAVLPVLVGLWWRRDLLKRHPGHWVMILVGLPLTFFLYRVAVVLGYLSERHTLLMVFGGVYWAATGAVVIGERVAAGVGRLHPALAGGSATVGRTWALAVLGLLTFGPLLRTLSPLHADRAGFRQAGYWIAAHSLPGDQVDDAYCWAHFYAGRVFTEGTHPAAHEPTVHFVVMECSSNKHPRLLTRNEDEVLESGGVLRASWPVKRGRERAEVRVYEVPGHMPYPQQRPGLLFQVGS
jgi:hypothetical protein